MSATYKKLVATRFGKDLRNITRIDHEPIPTPGPNEVLLRVHYAGVNASDLNIAAGVYFTEGVEPPFGLGVDVAGQVSAVGHQVQHLRVGDYAVGMGIGMGYREYSCLPAEAVFPVPFVAPNSTTLLTSGLPSIIGLEEVGQMRSGETVLVSAAAGGVGHLAVQLAKLAGNHVIALVGSDSKTEFLHSLGADRVINYRSESLDQVLATEYPKGINLVFENVGGAIFDTCVQHLARLGRLVVCGAISEYANAQPQAVEQVRIYHHLLFKSASVRGFLFSDYPQLFAEKTQKLTELLLSGRLQVLTDPTPFLGVESVVDAIEHLYSGRNKGKVVVQIAH